MNDIQTPNYTTPNFVTQFVTNFEKSCISKISSLCAKRKQCRKAHNIFLIVSGGFCFLAAIFMAFSVNAQRNSDRKNKVLSLLSVISSVLSIITVWHAKKISEDELSLSKDIALFEDAINDAECIQK